MKRQCRECGSAFEGSKAAEFCKDTSCRRDWNNRRQQRGAELYDFFMTIRHERSLTASLIKSGWNLWTMACQLATDWKNEDRDERGGRRSYQYIPDVLETGKYGYLKAAVFSGQKIGRSNNNVARKGIS